MQAKREEILGRDLAWSSRRIHFGTFTFKHLHVSSMDMAIYFFVSEATPENVVPQKAVLLVYLNVFQITK